MGNIQAIECCTVRQDEDQAFLPPSIPQQTSSSDVLRAIGQSNLGLSGSPAACLSPLYGGALDSRRLAVGSDSGIRVSRIVPGGGTAGGPASAGGFGHAGPLWLDFDVMETIDLPDTSGHGSWTLAAFAFGDPLSARRIIAALNPRPANGNGVANGRSAPTLRVFDLQSKQNRAEDWSMGKEDITCMAVTVCHVFVGDCAGCCWLFHKKDGAISALGVGQRGPKGARRLHQCPVVALEADPQYVYSMSADRCISIWDQTLAEEKIRFIVAVSPGHLQREMRSLTGIARPNSRWGLIGGASGWPKNATAAPSSSGPIGLLFLAGLGAGGEGLLMTWNLATKAGLTTVRAHDGKIAAMAFGPHDNGPVITGGDDGCICLWDIFSLRCVARVPDPARRSITAFAAEPQRCFFSVHEGGTVKAWRVMYGDEKKAGGNKALPTHKPLNLQPASPSGTLARPYSSSAVSRPQ